MYFEVSALDYDDRIKNFMVTAKADYEWYLQKTMGSEDNLKIQRDIIKGTKPYRNLRSDLKAGCILPTIVIAVRDVDDVATQKYEGRRGLIDAELDDLKALEDSISGIAAANVDIVDGLQRTNALRTVLSELDGRERDEFLARPLRLEIWVNIPFFPLAYRMLLLNAGQRPMSMKHQIDILSGGLADDLKDLPGIEIFRVKDHKRRVKPGQFHLSTLGQAFQAWIQRNPNVDRTNLVVETMAVDEALESLGLDLSGEEGGQRDGFRQFVDWVLALDLSLGDERCRFFGNDTVMLGFAAAVGFADKNEVLRARVGDAMRKLIEDVNAHPEGDPLGVDVFERVRTGVDTKRSNVGEWTRALVFRAVREYIMQAGMSSMSECWAQAASVG